jgi:hypothetical protein
MIFPLNDSDDMYMGYHHGIYGAKSGDDVGI